MDAQTLIFNNVELLGYVHENRFLGEKSFSLNSVKKISLQGFVLDLLNDNGVKKIFNDVEQIKKLFQNFNRIVIGNIDYGTGKTLSLSVDAGNWVRTTRFQAEVEILGNASYPILNDFNNYDTNFFYSEEKLRILYDDEKFKLIKNLSESFDIQRDLNNRTIQGTQNIEIELDSSSSREDREYLLSLSYEIADALFNTIPAGGERDSSFPSNPDAKISEFIPLNLQRSNSKFLGNDFFDIINGVFRFSRNFSYKIGDLLNKLYSNQISNSISLDKDGLITVTENGRIKLENNYILSDGLKKLQYPSEILSRAFSEISQGAFGRCNSVFTHYCSNPNKFNISGVPISLRRNPISRTSVFNQNDEILEYTITFNNDARYGENNCYWERNIAISQDIQKNIWTVTVSGKIQAIHQFINIVPVKYITALNFWNNVVKNNISNSAGLFYTNRTRGKPSSLLKLISTTFEKSEYQGSINYNYVYNDDTSINLSSDVRQSVEEIKDDGHIELAPIFKEYIVPNNPYTIVQNRNLKRLGTVSGKIQYLIAEANAPGIFFSKIYINNMFDRLKSILNSYGISSNRRYLESISFSSDEVEQNLSLECTFKYLK